MPHKLIDTHLNENVLSFSAKCHSPQPPNELSPELLYEFSWITIVYISCIARTSLERCSGKLRNLCANAPSPLLWMNNFISFQAYKYVKYVKYGSGNGDSDYSLKNLQSLEFIQKL